MGLLPTDQIESRTRLALFASYILAFAGLVLCLAGTASEARAEAKTAAVAETIAALFVSDIHFDPFLDPAKVSLLEDAQPSDWRKVLAGAASIDRAARFAALEKACPTRGEDTSFALFDSSLQAVRKNAADARFVTVSGDLLAHSFDCKYRAVFPHAAPGDYRGFVEKTLTFVVDELRAALPGVPVFVALGNNDSDCGDYKLDAHSKFLSNLGEELTAGFPASERAGAKETFAAGGYMSARLPAPMRNARLLVLDDLFMSAKYTTCGGKPDASAAEAELAWLEQQLTVARGSHEKVWVMAHIPPGVDVYASAKHLEDVCGAKGPKMFLASEKLAEILARFGDVVRLAIFAHTHMDEVRILQPENAGKGASTANGVPVKMVSSISPINGNASSFTVARVDPETAELKDYRVVAASNATGVNTVWKEEYDWAKTYREPEFSATGVSKEIAGFESDSGEKTKDSRDYVSNFYVGASPLLGLIWPQYVCALRNDSAQAFKICVCPAGR